MKVEHISKQEAEAITANERETTSKLSCSVPSQKLGLLGGLLTSIIVIHLSLPLHISPIPITDFNFLVEDDPQECSDETHNEDGNEIEYNEMLIRYDGNEADDGCGIDPLDFYPSANDITTENCCKNLPDDALLPHFEDFGTNLDSDGHDDDDVEFQTNTYESEIESRDSDIDMHMDKQADEENKVSTSATVVHFKRDSKRNCESRYRDLKLAWNECEVCFQTLPCEAALEKHRVLVHKLFHYVCCHSCGKMFPNHTCLVWHRSKNKTGPCFTNNPSDLKPAAASHFPLRNQVKGRIFCSIEGCNEVFQLEELLTLHLKTHGKWSCVICPMEFDKAHELAKHEVYEHPNPNITYRRSSSRYKCSCCDCSYKEMRAIVNHFLDKHLGIRDIFIRKPIGTVWWPEAQRSNN